MNPKESQITSTKETQRFKAAIIEKGDLEVILPSLASHRLVLPRVPGIIHLDKLYSQFSVEIHDEAVIPDRPKCSTEISASATKIRNNHVAVLLKPDAATPLPTVELTLTFNAEFFTHTELISKLTDGKIQFSAYEMIGDIVHLNLTESQLPYKQIIADVIFFKTGNTVINKTGKIEEDFRFYHSEVLAGENRLTTVHIENDVRFFIDLGKVYWCSRLQNERARLIKMVKRNETICDPFCGVGPHILPAIKKGAIGLCNDLNPSAVECLKKSLVINRLTCECVENMDAAEFLKSIRGRRVNHFVFNLPEYSLDYICHAGLFEGSFLIHVFFFNREDESCSEMIKKRTGYTVRDSWLREVRKVSPSKSVYKLEVRSDEFEELNSNWRRPN